MKSRTSFAVALLVLLGALTVTGVRGQTPDADLDQLLGPIALYPDPLLAEILPAATQPSQIQAAAQFVQTGQDASQADTQSWDDSVKALVRYPAVLKWLNDNMPWTTAVGREFLASQQTVMDAVQRLRARAAALGNLKSTPQQQVVSNDGDTEILPADPDNVYVPVYQPDQAFYYAPPVGGAWVTFGIGYPVGIWLGGDFDWHRRHIVYWPHDHPRPPGWWGLPPGRRSQPGFGGRSPIVWAPRERGAPGVAPRGPDRGWGALEVGPRARPDLERISRPVTLPRPVERQGGRPVERTGERPTEPAPRVTEPAARGAMIGVHSAQETHSYSTRGAASRSTVSHGGGGGGGKRR